MLVSKLNCFYESKTIHGSSYKYYKFVRFTGELLNSFLILSSSRPVQVVSTRPGEMLRALHSRNSAPLHFQSHFTINGGRNIITHSYTHSGIIYDQNGSRGTIGLFEHDFVQQEQILSGGVILTPRRQNVDLVGDFNSNILIGREHCPMLHNVIQRNQSSMISFYSNLYSDPSKSRSIISQNHSDLRASALRIDNDTVQTLQFPADSPILLALDHSKYYSYHCLFAELEAKEVYSKFKLDGYRQSIYSKTKHQSVTQYDLDVTNSIRVSLAEGNFEEVHKKIINIINND
jgi:hypothetical protein